MVKEKMRPTATVVNAVTHVPWWRICMDVL